MSVLDCFRRGTKVGAHSDRHANTPLDESVGLYPTSRIALGLTSLIALAKPFDETVSAFVPPVVLYCRKVRMAISGKQICVPSELRFELRVYIARQG